MKVNITENAIKSSTLTCKFKLKSGLGISVTLPMMTQGTLGLLRYI